MATLEKATLAVGSMNSTIGRGTIALRGTVACTEIGWSRVDRQIHQAAISCVEFPTTVIAACSVTSQFREVALSKKCQVQAHIALTRAGSIANDSPHQA